MIEVNDGKVYSVKNVDDTENKSYAEQMKIYMSPDVIAVAFRAIGSDSSLTFNKRMVIYDSVYGFPRYSETLPSEKGPTDVGYSIEIVEFENLPKIKAKQ